MTSRAPREAEVTQVSGESREVDVLFASENAVTVPSKR